MMTKTEKAVDAWIALLAIVPNMLFRGWLLVKLWGWFVVPLGIMPIVFWHAMGLSLLLNFAIAREPRHPERDWNGTKAAAHALLLTLFAWGFASLYLAFWR